MPKIPMSDIIDELDELGIDFNENELSYDELSQLLRQKKEELKLTKYKKGASKAPEEKKIINPLPAGTIKKESTPEEIQELQSQGLLIGCEYSPKVGGKQKCFAIIKQ